jgi:hypothetical protein
MAIQIDLTEARLILDRVHELFDEVEGFSTSSPDTMTGPGRRNDPELARVTRQLTEAADMLTAASSAARIQWYVLKGSGDPRRPQRRATVPTSR